MSSQALSHLQARVHPKPGGYPKLAHLELKKPRYTTKFGAPVQQ